MELEILHSYVNVFCGKECVGMGQILWSEPSKKIKEEM